MLPGACHKLFFQLHIHKNKHIFYLRNLTVDYRKDKSTYTFYVSLSLCLFRILIVQHGNGLKAYIFQHKFKD